MSCIHEIFTRTLPPAARIPVPRASAERTGTLVYIINFYLFILSKRSHYLNTLRYVDWVIFRERKKAEQLHKTIICRTRWLVQQVYSVLVLVANYGSGLVPPPAATLGATIAQWATVEVRSYQLTHYNLWIDTGTAMFKAA